MSRTLKILLGLALIVPMAAYVVGSLVASSADAPADRSPVIIQDAPQDAGESATPRKKKGEGPTNAPRGTKRGPDSDGDDRNGADDRREVKGDNPPTVVTPKPTPVGGDDDDDDNDDRDDDRDDDDDDRDDDDDDRDDDDDDGDDD